MLQDEKLIELEKELTNIKMGYNWPHWNKNKRKEPFSAELKNVLYCKGPEEPIEKGVGFLINKRIFQNIIMYERISRRVAEHNIKI